MDAERPLAGRVVLLTRPAGRGGVLAARLARLGAVVERRPTIAFGPPRDPGPAREAVGRLAEFDWLVFTSPRGASSFRAVYREVHGRELASTPSIAAIGSGTTRALERCGLAVLVTAPASCAEGLAQALAPRIRSGDRVLVVRAEAGREVLPESLRRRGAGVLTVAFYRTIEAPGLGQIASDVAAGRYDAVLFTSPSTFERLLAGAGAARSALMAALCRTRIVSLGPVTARALERHGIRAAAVATDPSDDALERSFRSLFV